MTNLKNKAVILLSAFLLSSCIYFGGPDDEFEYNSKYEPVLVKRENFSSSVELLSPQTQKLMGKIYVKDNYLFISEPHKGFHIYDNSNPSSPIKLKFLKVLGSSDVSIKSDVLYINNAVDLIALTFKNDFSGVTVTKRVENVFPEMVSPDGYYAIKSSDEVVVDWKLKN
ncbi:hypothetical protein [Algibacter sp. 2305UL17-15]|uniref:hypothetical protein n=1 Tax=Algibacter sp. 2305UL17-15 TaxID=3231268 RepID=UPI0034596B9B